MQKTGITVLAISIIIIGAVLVWYVMGSGSFTKDQSATDDATQALRDQLPEVVATVNGEEIDKQSFITLGEQIAVQQSSQEVDISSPEIQLAISNQALNLLVNQALLLQAAQAEGVEVDSSALDEQYAVLVQGAGGADQLQDQLDKANITQEQIREDLRMQLLIQAYLENKLDLSSITVSDEEIQSFYDLLQAEQEEDTPAFDEVRDQIVLQLRSEKEAQLVADHLATLRESADIQVNI
ncbi:MAG: SurA N-terminal domain-containing protein [Patescibacteria group bacterium]